MQLSPLAACPARIWAVTLSARLAELDPEGDIVAACGPRAVVGRILPMLARLASASAPATIRAAGSNLADVVSILHSAAAAAARIGDAEAARVYSAARDEFGRGLAHVRQALEVPR